MLIEQIKRNGAEVGILRKEIDNSGVYLHFSPSHDRQHPISFDDRDALATYLDREFPEGNSRPLADQKAIHAYLLGGHGTFTILNTASGCRYTFKVSSPADSTPEGPRFLAVLTGSDNTSDYQYLGQLYSNGETQLRWVHGRKSGIKATAKSALSIAWFINALNANALPSFVEVYHEGTCCRCGRKLTTPESVEAGIGPVCATKD